MTLAGRVGLGFQFVNELVEFVEIDAGPETERTGDRTGCRAPPRFCLLAKPSAERAVDHVPEREPEIARTPPQESGDVVVYGQCGAHERDHRCDDI